MNRHAAFTEQIAKAIGRCLESGQKIQVSLDDFEGSVGEIETCFYRAAKASGKTAQLSRSLNSKTWEFWVVPRALMDAERALRHQQAQRKARRKASESRARRLAIQDAILGRKIDAETVEYLRQSQVYEALGTQSHADEFEISTEAWEHAPEE